MEQRSTNPTMDVGDENRGRTRAARRTFTEAKNGFKTSEFYVMLVAVAGILITTYADEEYLSHGDAWRYAAAVVVAYIVSRGLAKLGTREPFMERYDD